MCPNLIKQVSVEILFLKTSTKRNKNYLSLRLWPERKKQVLCMVCLTLKPTKTDC